MPEHAEVIPNDAASSSPPRVAVCVITFQRPRALRRLLGELRRLEFAEPAPYLRLVVVDNDPAESARSICEVAASELPWPLDYLVEPQPGIAPARNTAIRAALEDAAWIAFIDDDETPTPRWLAEALATQRACRADVVAGPAMARYETPVASWISRGRFFDRPRRPTGSSIRWAATCNVLIRAAILRESGLRFDERFALTGGSDTHFFRRLSRRGYKLVWADEAVVHEHIPASRATVRWLVQRAFRTGNSMGRIDRDLDGGRAIPVIAGKGAAWLLVGGVVAVVGLLGGRATALRGIRYLAYGVGLLASLAGLRFQEYKRPVAGND